MQSIIFSILILLNIRLKKRKEKHEQRQASVDENISEAGASDDKENRFSLIYLTRKWKIHQGKEFRLVEKDSMNKSIIQSVDWNQKFFFNLIAKCPIIVYLCFTETGNTSSRILILRKTEKKKKYWTIYYGKDLEVIIYFKI